MTKSDQAALQDAVSRHQAGDLDGAAKLYRRVLKADPGETNALRLLGVIRMQQGDLDEAETLISRSIERNERSADSHYFLGRVLLARNSNDAAAAALNRCIAIDPRHDNALVTLGMIVNEAGRRDQALDLFKRALAVNPRLPEAWYQQGRLLQQEGRSADALVCFERALAARPAHAEALNERGNALRALGRYAEALASFDRALALNAKFAAALYNRGAVLAELNRYRDATASLDQAVAAEPDNLDARFAACVGELPILYVDEAEIARQRAAYERRLLALREAIKTGASRFKPLSQTGAAQAFYLAYQGKNDRELQALNGALVCELMGRWYKAAALAPPPAASEPVKVGIVSGYFHAHSNWKIPISGWLGQLDRRRFRVFGYYTGSRVDADTKTAAALCERFVQGLRSIEDWRTAIASDAPHVLIYPEVGMDHTAFLLAAMRLAPVQCNSWGHPDTSGFPTLDYYLGSDLMEPSDADGHYTERLVRLPNLSIYYEPLPAPSMSLRRAEIGLRDGATTFWCGQSLYKYLPQYDEAWPRIARQAGDCQFVFVGHLGAAEINDLFRQRLERSFAGFGLKAADHCVFLPRLETERFSAAIGACDIFLDSIGWSGCNSTLESLPHDLPIVTMPGTLMRGRHSAAILRMMDVTETVAETLDGYVTIAVRLARDTAWRAAVKRQIAGNKHKVYRDQSCIAALEDFLDRVARSAADSNAPNRPLSER